MQKEQNVMPRISIRTMFYIIVAISAVVSGCIIIWPSQLSIDHASGTEQGMLMNSGTSMLPPSVVRQEERHLILKMGCSTTKTIRSNDSLEYLIKKRKLLRNIIVNDDYKLLYCYIPKVASTQWKKVMGVLSGKLPNIPLSEINAEKTHERDVHQFLSDFPAAGIRNRLDTYTSFLFVRHPLERLVSGYRNKFAHAALDAYFPKHFATGIKARYGSRNTTRSSDNSGKHVQERVTFEEFARWVSDPHPTAGARNEHWAPMVEQCYPCSIPYTVIGNMETLVDDAHYVLRTANVTTIVFPEGFHSGTRRIAGEMLTSLPDDVFRRVLRLYLEDFIVFGYHPSEVFVGNRTAEIIAMFENIPL